MFLKVTNIVWYSGAVEARSRAETQSGPKAQEIRKAQPKPNAYLELGRLVDHHTGPFHRWAEKWNEMTRSQNVGCIQPSSIRKQVPRWHYTFPIERDTQKSGERVEGSGEWGNWIEFNPHFWIGILLIRRALPFSLTHTPLPSSGGAGGGFRPRVRFIYL